MASALCNKASLGTVRPSLRPSRPARAVVQTRAMLAAPVVISASTAAFLTIGRFVFLPFQRRNFEGAEKRAGPKTDDSMNTYTDSLQKPASFAGWTNDPAGFNIIDVLGWGALGHAIGFAILAISSLHDAGVYPVPNV